MVTQFRGVSIFEFHDGRGCSRARCISSRGSYFWVVGGEEVSKALPSNSGLSATSWSMGVFPRRSRPRDYLDISDVVGRGGDSHSSLEGCSPRGEPDGVSASVGEGDTKTFRRTYPHPHH